MSNAIQEMFDLHGRTALVTGGSRGLGLQIAEALGDAGAKIMLTSRKAADLEEAAAHLTKRGVDASWIAADAIKPDEVKRVCDETLKSFGAVDILINNAGTSWGAPAEDHSLDGWDKVMNLNVRSMFLFSQILGKQCMIPRRQGRIINIASFLGFFGNPPGQGGSLAYNTSKGAVVNFTRTLAAEWGQHNITVNAIAPGYFPSKMTEYTISHLGEKEMAAWAPLNRLGDEEDLKGASLLFASVAGKHITGQTLIIDGGVSAVISGRA